MSTFDDVAAFAARHAGCAGLVPRVHSPRDGGYMLAITCACGAVHERWVTADEARALPTGAPPAPSPEPLAAPDEVLAEPAGAAGPPPSPAPFGSPPRRLPLTPGLATIFRRPARPKPTASGPSADTVSHAAAATTPGSPGDPQVTKPRRWLVLLLTLAAVCLAAAGALLFWGTDLDWRRSAPPASGTAQAVGARTLSSPSSPMEQGSRARHQD